MKELHVVELSGEHPSLPISDALGSLMGLGCRPQFVISEPRVMLFRPGVGSRELAARVALSRFVGRLLGFGSLPKVRDVARSLDLAGSRFRLRVVDHGGSLSASSLEAEMGGDLARTGLVDLERPERDLRLLVSRSAYLYEVEAEVDRSAFDTRRAGQLPAFRPVTLHPKLARALVNMTGVQRGGSLLDPFCGTGGILAEAALVGARALGSDLSVELVEECRENMRFLQLEADLRVLDVGRVADQFGKVDAIATDPPYGRSTSTRGEELSKLIDRAFASFREALKPGGTLTISLPHAAYLDVGKAHLRLREWHALRVHRSLVRHFAVFERPM